MKILGIDEAGRGPVLGPLVMCGYLIDEKNVSRLKSTGVKDSKLLTRKKRESIAKEIKNIAEDIVVLSISAKEIDGLRLKSNLNRIEIEKMQQIINMLEPDKAIVDAIEANTKKFHEKLCKKISDKIVVVAENVADKNYMEVGAASIIAKVHRDEEMDRLNKKYNCGSGYTSDERTISFLKNWIVKNKEFPDFVRKSWMTIQWIKNEKEQKTIGNWLRKE